VDGVIRFLFGVAVGVAFVWPTRKRKIDAMIERAADKAQHRYVWSWPSINRDYREN
jgi:hypothetical protein